ncbi:hypothetical protein GOP47_0010634 [Adiantum capillus-veneris]|uniref:RRM domain-containing protein n=1 Tax=Adiantum capillus-veneris TaxID=13818 RepID=A0A9D4UW79_ADICA|nr:hypothetical protein GOP47_0010634 [Adiantum capillus-veneris]
MSGRRVRGRKRQRAPLLDPDECMKSPSPRASKLTPTSPSSSCKQIGSPKRFGTLLLALNLPEDSVYEELQAFFASFGKLKELEFQYDHHHEFMCTAKVEYEREQDALAAADRVPTQRFHGHAIQIIPLSCLSRRR